MSNRMTTVVWFLLGITLTLSVVLAVIVFGGDDEPAGTAVTTVTTSPVTSTSGAVTTTAPVTTSSEATTTTSTTVATTTTAAPACAGLPSATTPGVGPGVSFAGGDFDGDGAMDRLIGYQTAGGDFRIQMALAYGYATEIDAYTTAVALAAQPFAYPDAWVGLATVDMGASTEVLQFFHLDGCNIVKTTIDGVFEASFLRGGGVTHMDGLACGAEGFQARSATTGDGITWEFRTTDYEWDPVARTFVTIGTASSTLVSPADDAIIFSAAEFTCPFAP